MVQQENIGFDNKKNPIIMFDDNVKHTIEKWSYVFSIKDEDNNESYYRYIRFPLKLAWAQTIHKSQGQSLNNIEIDINNKYSLSIICFFISN